MSSLASHPFSLARQNPLFQLNAMLLQPPLNSTANAPSLLFDHHRRKTTTKERHILNITDMAQAKQQNFPLVQGGGSLIVAWQIKGKRVLVVGGGEVAAGRILNVLNADALVTVVSPLARLNPEVAYRVSQNQITHIDRNFLPQDLDGADMVLVAVDDPEASSAIWRLCKERRIPANIADVPPECDFYFGSVHRDGPLQIMVSTNGKGPRLASTIRKFIAKQLPNNAGSAIESVGQLRVKLRQIAPRPEDGPKRMTWMTKVSDAYSLAQMCELTEEDMSNLLRYYPSGRVPSWDILLSLRGNPDGSKLDVFDGSFGFSVGA